MVRWCWVTSSAGASYNLDDSRARAYCACSRCGWGLFGHFYSPLSFLSSFSLSLETARYRLKYCLKGPFNPKQPTNQCTNLMHIPFILFKGISKSILINPSLNYMISFQCEKCNYLALIWSGGPDQFTASKKYAPLGLYNILNLARPPPSPHIQTFLRIWT